MAKIVINGRFMLHRITGVERFAHEILRELDTLAEKDELELALPSSVKEVPSFNNIHTVIVGKLNNRLWEHISFPIYVKKHSAVSLNLCNVAPLPDPGMVCVFDMKIREHPEFFSRKFVMWYRLLFANVFCRARYVFTDSNSAKKDILRYYDFDPNRIIVTPCSWEHYTRISFDERTLPKFGLQKGKFFFAMGSLDPNKNFMWIAKAAKCNPQKTFVIAGSINQAVFSGKTSFECPDNMKLVGYVSDQEAKTLMRDCEAFLFPSISEGFGIPPLEALSAGAPAIIVSDIPVMHELFEDVATFIDPCHSSERLSTRFISMEERKRILDKYQWKKSAQTILNICRQDSGTR